MKKRRYAVQRNLFGETKTKELQHQVKELDAEINKALKYKDYQKAKELTLKQEKFIQKLVHIRENQDLS